MQKITEILSKKITANRQKIAGFFAEKFSKNLPLFYNSVDLRHSGFKIAPVDTNCFPSGFNNLSAASREKAKLVTADFLQNNFPTVKKILILAESHTRNSRYFENILSLQEIIGSSKEVVIGSLIPHLKEKTALNLENGHSITLHPVVKMDNKIATIEGFITDLIILNNDLTDGIPEILQDLETPIIPPSMMGWHNRTKSNHFTIYNTLASELAKIMEIDPWLISSKHLTCTDVNFKEQKGLECVAEYVDELIENLKKKYQEYNIDEEPYCYVKADSGTYGIAVWPVFSGKEILEINKKERNKMNMLKGSVQNTHVIIQEGVKTIDRIEGKISEPMIYLINAQVVGNLFRVNENRDEKISLNAAGASFFDLEILTDNQIKIGSEKSKIAEIYEILGKLAALASAIENQQNLTHNAKN